MTLVQTQNVLKSVSVPTAEELTSPRELTDEPMVIDWTQCIRVEIYLLMIVYKDEIGQRLHSQVA